jgi:riboflavin transporter
MKTNQMSVQKLTLASMFTALGVLMASPVVSLMVMLFGVPAVRIDLIAIPVILAGVILGPIFGLTVGIITDILAFLLFTSAFGPYHLGFTLNLALTGLIPGLFVLGIKKIKIQLPIFWINVSFLSLLSSLSIIYLLQTNELRIEGNMYELSSTFKTVFIISIILFFSILLFSMVYKRKLQPKERMNMDSFMLIVLFIEVFVVILLTPIWVNDLYNLPSSLYLPGVFIRVLRAMWLIPLKVYIIYYLHRVSKKVFEHSLAIQSNSF